MPTLTIDLPDSVSIPHARTFVLEKLHEAGFFPSDPSEQSDEDEVDDDPDSWFTPEMRRQAKENRRRLEEEARKRTPKYTKEEFYQILLNGPVADEETIKTLEEIQEMRQRWNSPW